MTKAIVLIGKNIYHFLTIPSTNNLAKQLAESGESEGTVVVADIQTEGRGRGSRKWLSSLGGLYLSLILRPELPVERVGGITLTVGVAVAKAIISLYGLDAKLKWPNDVLINKRKVCGILTESGITGGKLNFIVVGIGVNLNNDVKDELLGSTSIRIELNQEVSKQEFTKTLLSLLEKEYKRFLKKGLKDVLKDWRALSNDIERDIVIRIGNEEDVRGSVLDVDENGCLVVQDNKGKKRRIVSADDISIKEY